MSTMTDAELDRLRERFPLGSLVRAGTGFVDKGVHIVVGHTRMDPPYRSVQLVLATPNGETVRARPEFWRLDDPSSH